MTSYAQRKDHPLHEEFLRWRRNWERGKVRREYRKKRYDLNPIKYRTKAVEYAKKHRMSRKVYEQKIKITLRDEMVVAYGGHCVCCGEDEVSFLSIDHIHNDGYKDPVAKSKVKGKYQRLGGTSLYRKLKKLGWPKDRYQLMCYNCNLGKGFNGGVCPHQKHSALRTAI